MTADTIGGVWTYAMELIRGLAAHDIRVVLATMGGPVQPHQRQAVAALGNAVELHESDFHLEWMNDPWDDVAAAGGWLLALERRYRPDIIHLNGYVHAALPWSSPVVVVAHSCVFSWWEAVKRTEPPESWATYRQAVRRGLQSADLVVAPSRAMLESLYTHYGRLLCARVIPNGRDASQTAGLGKEPFVLSVGRLWDEAKNATTLALIAPDLPWPVHLAGEARSPNGDGLSLENVKLLGHLPPDELAGEYGRASIYALPARYEPFGLSILEAAHAGCALVLGDIPSLREIWGSAASFVPPNDSVALAGALQALINDDARRIELGERARARAANFSASQMTQTYVSVYRDLRTRAESFARTESLTPA
jgi:glycogen(starch) synthase